MLKEFEGVSPILDECTYVAEGAKVIGNVVIGQYSSVWFNTVIRGDVNRIEIGKYSNIQDNSTVHVADKYPTIIGDYVTVGHNAVIHACTIEEHCLIGMSSTVLNGAVVGKGSIIAACALVMENQVIPPYSLVVGVPGKVIKTLPENFDNIHAQALKYKTLWTKRYGLLKEAGGEEYNGETIV